MSTASDFHDRVQRLGRFVPVTRPDPYMCERLAKAWGKHNGMSEEEALENWDPTRVYYDPDYMTGSPGYTGPHVVQVWDGSPEYVTIYTFNNAEGEWEVIDCGVE